MALLTKKEAPAAVPVDQCPEVIAATEALPAATLNTSLKSTSRSDESVR